MRLPTGRPILAGVAAAGLLLTLSCNGSHANDVAGPTSPMSTFNISGAWSGTYHSDTPALCSGSSAQANLMQNGNTVTGQFEALGCGINGTVRASISGSTLSGSVYMIGCTGGSITGTVSAAGLSFQVSEFHKTLLPGGPQDVKAGGAVSLSR
jgi:hypothetical protein